MPSNYIWVRTPQPPDKAKTKKTKKTEEQPSDDMTVAELKELCRERGLRVTGNKNELLERLEEDNDNDETSAEQPPAKKAKTTSTKHTEGNIGRKLKAAGCDWESHCAALAIVRDLLRWTGTEEELDQPAVVRMGGCDDSVNST